MKKTVPLVTYEGGHRRVVGEALVDIQGDSVVIIAEVKNEEFAEEISSGVNREFSLAPMAESPIELHTWNDYSSSATVKASFLHASMSLADLIESWKEHVGQVASVTRDAITVSGQLYTAADIPMLDEIHERLGIGEFWQKSSRRAAILATKSVKR